MVRGIDDPAALRPMLRQASVIAIGPGLGRDEWALGLWAAAFAAKRPLVVDADALRLLATEPIRRDDWVLTPHPGEAAALLGLCIAELNANRPQSAERMRERYGGSVVLKGAGSIVSSDGNAPPAVCTDGNPGMASGGMGDVLTGVIAGLLAQGMDLRDASECGVCLHAAAADAAAAAGGERGLIASDVIAHLRSLVNPG
jgi:NAD(P)H-hydrate epimerase